MKHLEETTLTSIAPVTRREKLYLWASLVRGYQGHLRLYHNLEHFTPEAFKGIHVMDPAMESAFSLAIKSGSFPGLGRGHYTTLDDIVRYFDLSQAELHEFSCDCGGAITNHDMAARIESIAR